MNSEEQSQDFEKLQRLLKLKRYEQPPPRYFNDFSTQVIGHIRADTSIRRFEKADDLISRSPWLRRLWRKLENQPGLTGALATVVCGVMVAGVFLMEETPAHKINWTAVGDGPVNHEPAPAAGLGENFATVATAPALVSSTNLPNLFQQIPPGFSGPDRQPGQPNFIYGKRILEP
jgi:hypothetical protein